MEVRLGLRIAIAIGIIVSVILAMFILVRLLEGTVEAAEPQLYQGISLDEHLLKLDKIALEEAYKAHVLKLWGVFMSDGAKEAHRITTGLRISRQAYEMAAQQIEKREQQLKAKP